jgi:hypothetical protein
MTISLHLNDVKVHDRIRAEFEKWVKDHPPTDGVPDLSFHQGRYDRAVIRHMWAAWQKQSERVSDLIAQLDRSHKRSTELLKQCRDHDTRRAAAVAQCAAMAEEIERLNAIISRLSAEGQDAVEM